ncbi:hypothetical protein VTN49DRAFT_655 [Thermomyces lanuginosus]|uniref:mitochondrial 54S ribosomal protein bL28m n=1 Tax=Thermomyces lanuginosus TaxID=5541 RepID=UPI0037425C6E
MSNPARAALNAANSLTAAFRGLSLTTTPARSFSTTPVVSRNKKLPEHIPPYPYGPRRTYKQADFGLYGGAEIQFGNKVSKGRNHGKTRRAWRPNVRWKKLHSDALNEDLYIKVTKKALRTIEKCGGLDNYLLGDSPSRIKELGMFGWELRYRVMQSPAIQERFKKEREELGLPEPPTFEEWLEQKKKAEAEKAAASSASSTSTPAQTVSTNQQEVKSTS